MELSDISFYFDRLFVLFLFEIWALTGGWELSGLRHAFWIMIHAPIMVIGLTGQVINLFYPICDSSFQNDVLES